MYVYYGYIYIYIYIYGYIHIYILWKSAVGCIFCTFRRRAVKVVESVKVFEMFQKVFVFFREGSTIEES